MASEEQKKELKTKITVAVILLLVGSTIYGFGPGLPRVVDHWRKKKEDPAAPKWLYAIACIYSATYREDKAKDLWEDYYLMYSGNEAKNASLDKALIALDEEGRWDQRYFIPWVANKYNDTNKRPAWVGGEDAQPDPHLQDVLYDYGKWWEDQREYSQARHLYAVALYCFPGGTKTAQRLEAAKIRMIVKGYKF